LVIPPSEFVHEILHFNDPVCTHTDIFPERPAAIARGIDREYHCERCDIRCAECRTVDKDSDDMPTEPANDIDNDAAAENDETAAGPAEQAADDAQD
jgi:hypothetical protein